MLAMTDDMFIYVCLSLKMMKAYKLIITRAFFLKSFVILFCWEVGRSRGLRRHFWLLLLLVDLYSLLEMRILRCLLCSVYSVIKSFFIAAVLCHDVNIFRQSGGLGFELVAIKSSHLNLWVVYQTHSARFVFHQFDCLHLWHVIDNTQQLQ